MLEQGAAEYADAVRPALRHPARRRPGRPVRGDPDAALAGRVARASSSTRWPARTAGSRSSRSSYAATTGATSTPGSARCGPESDRPSGGRGRRPATGVLARMTRWRSPCCSSPWPSACSPSRAGRPAGLPRAAAADRGRRRGVVPAGRAGGAPRARGGAARAAAAAALRDGDPDLAGRLQRQPAPDPAALGRAGVFTTAGIGAVVHAMLPAIAWAVAFAIGAVVAPPDAVAATAIGRRIGLPRRIVTILEGESLLNDATALVALRTATAIIVVGSAGRRRPGGSAADFVLGRRWAASSSVWWSSWSSPGCAARSPTRCSTPASRSSSRSRPTSRPRRSTPPA